MPALKTVAVFDKGLDKRNFTHVVSGRLYNASEINAPRIYNGPNADTDEDFQVIDAAFHEFGTLITTDYKMLAKARTYHRYVVGHRGNRCLRGCVVIPDSVERQREKLKRFRREQLHLFYVRKDGRRIAGTLSWSQAWNLNLGINMRSEPCEVFYLCGCTEAEE